MEAVGSFSGFRSKGWLFGSDYPRIPTPSSDPTRYRGGESAALPGVLVTSMSPPSFSAEPVADRQTQPGAAVFSGGRVVRWLNGSKQPGDLRFGHRRCPSRPLGIASWDRRSRRPMHTGHQSNLADSRRTVIAPAYEIDENLSQPDRVGLNCPAPAPCPRSKDSPFATAARPPASPRTIQRRKAREGQHAICSTFNFPAFTPEEDRQVASTSWTINCRFVVRS